MIPKYIICHHSAINQDGKPQLQRIDASHKARKFPKSSRGYYVGYHCVIEQNGTVSWTRAMSEMGAHCVANGRNFDSIGIVLAGDFRTDVPTKEQVESLKNTIDNIVRQYPIPWERIQRHGDQGATACWGMKETVQELISQFTEPTPSVSEWAVEAVENAKLAGILDWSNPQEIVGTMNDAHMYHRCGLLDFVFNLKTEEYIHIMTAVPSEAHNYGITKEQRAVILDRTVWNKKS